MRQVVILGSPNTKRTTYLRKAAEQDGLPVTFVDWADQKDWYGLQRLSNAAGLLVKIDPPQWTSCSLDALNQHTDGYIQQLAELDRMENTVFFNAPSSITGLLDKQACKARLQEAGLPVTEAVRMSSASDGGTCTVDALLEEMRRQHVHQVFIKPIKGSGAAGVAALRLHVHTGRMALYTCALLQPNMELINTKCLRQFSRTDEIVPLLNRILALDCIVERWYGKAVHQGYAYDLRAVVQDGQLDYLLARLSKGPVTNLHLNNHPLDIAQLGLSGHAVEEIAQLCRAGMALYPGLRSAGIDILLEKGSMRPRIIEMNAQGDLIYQDIYHENSIYRHQARMMKEYSQNGE
ncbi:MAG: STM4014 family protein [Lachnospiraceae bacterium]|nr:STM4014 family protein [Lachnospiraceae bacterium]